MADSASTEVLVKVASVVSGMVSGLALYFVNMLRGEIKTLKIDTERDLALQQASYAKSIDILFVDLKTHKKSVYERIDKSEDRILAAIKESAGERVLKGHCDDVQVLLTERSESHAAADAKEHKALLVELQRQREDHTISANMVAEQIKTMAACIDKLAKGLEC